MTVRGTPLLLGLLAASLLRGASSAQLQPQPQPESEEYEDNDKPSSSMCEYFCKPAAGLSLCVAKSMAEIDISIMRESMQQHPGLSESVRSGPDYMFFLANIPDRKRKDDWCQENLCAAEVGKHCSTLARTAAPLTDMYGKTVAIGVAEGEKWVENLIKEEKADALLRMYRFATTTPRWLFTGLTSAVVALNYLLIEPPESSLMYSWWTEDNLLDSYGSELLRQSIGTLGVGMERLTTLLETVKEGTDSAGHGLDISWCKVRLGHCTEEELAKGLMAATLSPMKNVILAFYDAGALGQPGGQRWSPLVTFDCEKGVSGGMFGTGSSDNEICKTIIFDVARLKFEPQIVGISDLHKSMMSVSGGWVRLEVLAD